MKPKRPQVTVVPMRSRAGYPQLQLVRESGTEVFALDAWADSLIGTCLQLEGLAEAPVIAQQEVA